MCSQNIWQACWQPQKCLDNFDLPIGKNAYSSSAWKSNVSLAVVRLAEID